MGALPCPSRRSAPPARFLRAPAGSRAAWRTGGCSRCSRLRSRPGFPPRAAAPGGCCTRCRGCRRPAPAGRRHRRRSSSPGGNSLANTDGPGSEVNLACSTSASSASMQRPAQATSHLRRAAIARAPHAIEKRSGVGHGVLVELRVVAQPDRSRSAPAARRRRGRPDASRSRAPVRGTTRPRSGCPWARSPRPR